MIHQGKILRVHWSCRNNIKHRSLRTLQPKRSLAAYNPLEAQGCQNPCCPDSPPRPISLHYQDIELRRCRTAEWFCRIRSLPTIHICLKEGFHLYASYFRRYIRNEKREAHKVVNISNKKQRLNRFSVWILFRNQLISQSIYSRSHFIEE